MPKNYEPIVQRVVGIDWSGRADAAGQRRHIWAGIWTQDASGRITVQLEDGRTREQVSTWLIKLATETPRMVIGFDFCFSYPAWFVRDEHGVSSAPEFWKLVVEQGYGERWLARGAEDRRFWGKPHKRPPEFSGENVHRMLRATDIDCKIIAQIPEPERQARVKGITPKSVFQIGGSGSVGTASLRGFPLLLELRDAGFCIWPFDIPKLGENTPKPLVLEMYSRLNTGPVCKSNPVARAAYLLEKCKQDPAYATLPRTIIQRARGSEDAFDALVSTMVMAERRETFAALPKPCDPLHGIEGWTWAPGARQARSTKP